MENSRFTTNIKDAIKISILVPIYGVEKYIEKCARSLLEQDYENIEYIFVDDCSPDDSINILKHVMTKYPKRINQVKIIAHDRNRGLAAARNTAVENARGTYIMHVDSDDYLLNESVASNLIEEINLTDADAIIFDFMHIYQNFHSIESQDIPQNTLEYVCKLIRRECPVCLWSGIYKRELYINYNISAVEGLNFGEDYAVKPRLLYNAKRVIHIAKPFYCYVHTNNNSYTKNFNPNNINEQEKAIEILTTYFSNKPEKKLLNQSLEIAKIKVKAELLIDWGLKKNDSASWLRLIELYPNINRRIKCPLKYQIVLFLASIKSKIGMRLYVKYGILLASLMKKIKSRNRKEYWNN
jgi:glycosyltransferase involved in cell wall biosynthesis